MVTPLVSLTEAVLMKPPGGSLACVALSVSQLEHGGIPYLPDFIRATESSSSDGFKKTYKTRKGCSFYILT